jgi:hypothetical protein
VSEAETIAWNRMRRTRRLELGAAIASTGGLITMFAIFCWILTR